jgi:PAS domain S-box-containing protein
MDSLIINRMNELIQQPVKSSQIGRRLIIYVMLFSGFIILLTTALSLYLRYQDELREVDRQIEQIAIIQSEGIKSALWKLDEHELQVFLDSALQLRDISYLSLDGEYSDPVTAGTKPSENYISRDFPLLTKKGGKSINLGTLHVIASLEGIYSRLLDQLDIMLLTNAFTAFSISIFVFFFVQGSITDHLLRITGYTHKIDPDKQQLPLVLERTDSLKNRRDELSGLVSSINSLQDNLSNSYRALRNSEQRLTDFADAASDWLWELDANLRYSYVSDRFYAISGSTPDGFLGTNQRDLDVTRVDIDEWQDHLQRLAHRQSFRDFAFATTHPEGHEQWFRLSGIPIFDDDDAFIGYRGTGTDITGEMRAREEAVETTLRFLDAIENISDGIAFWNADGKFALCNGIFRKQAGPAAHLLVRGTDFESYLRGLLDHGLINLKHDRWEDWIDRRLAERDDPPDAREVYRNGRWLLIRDGRSPDGNMVSVTTDITDLKQREHQLEMITNAVPIMLAYIDQDRCFQLINKTYAEWFSRKQADIQEKAAVDIMDRDSYAALEPYINRALKGEFVRFEISLSKPQSGYHEMRRMEISYSPDFGRRGLIEGFFVAAIDISDRVRAEEELRVGERALQEQANILKASFDAIEEGIGVWDQNDRLVAWNNTFQRLLTYPDHMMKPGIQRSEFRKYLNASGATFGDLELAVDSSISPSFESTRQIGEYDLTMANGRHLNVHRFNMYDGGNVTTCRDVTEFKSAQQRLRQSQKMEAIGQLTGGIAHDFNNLLAVIVGSLNLLDDHIEDEKLQKLVAAALRASRRGAELTKRLLAFGRRQALITETADVNELIDGLIELLVRTMGSTAEIKTNLGDNLWPMKVDRGQLENAILNLAINARDAMPDGGKVTIETRNIILDHNYTQQYEDLHPGTYALISVSDTGVGMTEEVLERAVEPFFTTKEVGSGSGLGLSMIYGFVKQSGGHVRIYSELGHGTVVRLYLPTSESEEMAPEIDHSVEPVDMFESQGERILVIEDDPDVRQMALNVLHGLGYKTTSAENDEDAIELFGDGSDVDLVFSDVFLHGSTNGPEIIKTLRKKKPEIPVLFTSGYAADQFDNSDMFEENYHFIAKPFEATDLARILRELLSEDDITLSQ